MTLYHSVFFLTCNGCERTLFICLLSSVRSAALEINEAYSSDHSLFCCYTRIFCLIQFKQLVSSIVCFYDILYCQVYLPYDFKKKCSNFGAKGSISI